MSPEEQEKTDAKPEEQAEPPATPASQGASTEDQPAAEAPNVDSAASAGVSAGTEAAPSGEGSVAEEGTPAPAAPAPAAPTVGAPTGQGRPPGRDRPPPQGGRRERPSFQDRRRGGGGGGRFGRRKVCAFCVEKAQAIDYKDPVKLRRYLSDRARIEPRRKTGTCAKHQRWLSVALKRARHLALLPYTPGHIQMTGVFPSRR